MVTSQNEFKMQENSKNGNFCSLGYSSPTFNLDSYSIIHDFLIKNYLFQTLDALHVDLKRKK